MARWRVFVDVLDDLLTDRRESVEEFVARTGQARTRTSTLPIYTFAAQPQANRFWSRPGPYRDRPAMPSAEREETNTQVPRQPESSPSASDRRAPRRLKPAEMNALQTLVRLGAALDMSFTTRELRTAFRALAQRYHPDRHPGANDAERMRLGAAFAELTSAYGVLNDATR